MTAFPEGNAIVYCQGAFGTTNGKTAHGLVRRTDRYNVVSVVDRVHQGRDAGEVLDGIHASIPIWPDVVTAFNRSVAGSQPATHLVVGLAPDGGRIPDFARHEIADAIKLGLNVDSGLHDFLSEDEILADLARRHHVTLRDVRKPPARHDLHFFTGKIKQVTSTKIAVLGTDSAVGKRTTAWLLVDGLNEAGYTADLIGTGQTAWLQGVRYGILLDSLINDFVSGEIEHAVWSAWKEEKPDVLVLEGQGSLLNPAYPGGFELLAAGRPDFVILQHAPKRKEYDGFPGHPMHPLKKQIQAIELISGKSVAAVTLNHEDMEPVEIEVEARRIAEETGLPCIDVLTDGPEALVKAIRKYLPNIEEDEKHEETKYPHRAR